MERLALELDGRRVSYLHAGEGPPVLLSRCSCTAPSGVASGGDGWLMAIRLADAAPAGCGVPSPELLQQVLFPYTKAI
jgi:hypothetical protein